MSNRAPQQIQLTMDELKLYLFFSASTCRTEAGNAFFGSFQYVQELFSGNHSQALELGLDLLNKCRYLDPWSYERIHKGTAFYWLGTAAFLVNDFQAATFFYDAAVSEDLRSGHHPITMSTPSFKFLMLQGQQPRQAAQNLVQTAQDRVQDLIDDYIQRPGIPPSAASYDMNMLRNGFLAKALSPGNSHWRSLSTALVSFVLEWNYFNTFLDLRFGVGTAEPFFLHLFKGCVLFESLVRANPTNPPPANSKSLINVLQHVRHELKTPNNLRIGESSLPTILQLLTQSSGIIVDCVEFTGRIRNTIGHNLGWDIPLEKLQYQQLYRMIAISCIHVLACLY